LVVSLQRVLHLSARTGYMIAPGTKDEPLLPPGMKAHLQADLDQTFDF
jgi:hypothetical protein